MAEMIQGCVLAARRGEVVFASTFGVADSYSGESCAPDTRFQLASVSKQFTAATILTLVDRHELQLDDPVVRWLSHCPSAWRDMTIHHLLCHGSGLGHWEDYPDIDLYQPLPGDEFIEVLGRRSLCCRPGHAFRYSSPGYVLLARIAELVGELPYREFLQQSLFLPLGMEHTFVGTPDVRTDIARGHDGAKPTPSYELDTVGMGAGDAWSTVSDLIRWDEALRNGDVLSADSRAAMFHKHTDCGERLPETGYGYGWCLGPLVDRPARWHDGDNAGFKAMNAWFPGLSLHCAILSNQEATDSEAMRRVLETIIASIQG